MKVPQSTKIILATIIFLPLCIHIHIHTHLGYKNIFKYLQFKYLSADDVMFHVKKKK